MNIYFINLVFCFIKLEASDLTATQAEIAAVALFPSSGVHNSNLVRSLKPVNVKAKG